jgi:hypothetical protein
MRRPRTSLALSPMRGFQVSRATSSRATPPPSPSPAHPPSSPASSSPPHCSCADAAHNLCPLDHGPGIVRFRGRSSLRPPDASPSTCPVHVREVKRLPNLQASPNLSMPAIKRALILPVGAELRQLRRLTDPGRMVIRMVIPLVVRSAVPSGRQCCAAAFPNVRLSPQQPPRQRARRAAEKPAEEAGKNNVDGANANL